MSFPVLIYHHLADPPRSKYQIRPSVFETQLQYLQSEGFVVEGFRECEVRLETGNFPERYVIISFDDGSKSNLVAAELLEKYRFQATFFIIKRLCGTDPFFLNEPEAVELAQQFSVGSHGLTHRPLSFLPLADLQVELSESKKWLEDLTGEKVHFLSVPEGYINRTVIENALNKGYRLIGQSVEWWNMPHRINKTRLVHRIAIHPHYSLREFEKVLHQHLPFYIWRRVRYEAGMQVKNLRQHSLTLRK